MGDGQLRAELNRIVVGQETQDSAAQKWRWMSRFQDSPALRALAIGVCMFDRHPCDLPAGSMAYDEQKLAALMLTSHMNVQMDTGEGKTYAIALAATALLAEYPQVIVITVNAYLARRDQARVKPYFEAVGLPCEYGVPGPAFRGVAYMTLGDLCFGYLHRTYRRSDSSLPEYPIQAAVIIDEIDSVLLDQNLNHSVVRTLPSDVDLWENIFQLTADWDERQYIYNPVSDDFSLAAGAWEEISQFSRALGLPTSLLMSLTSAALWASRAKEGHHYIIQGGIVRLINQVTGDVYDSATAQWSALEYLIAQRNPPVSLAVADINGMTLLQRHPHVVGLSGTAGADTLYYLQQLGTLTSRVPPRFERYESEVLTFLASSREVTYEYIASRIREVGPRPVVIGAWSPAAARAVADWLRDERVIDHAQIAVITAFDSRADTAALEVAGEPGHVTVLSQGGSRGVDIRSVHRPLLLVLGRAVEPRLDRQFLGRVGRHGEPFDAEFILDPSSPVQVPFRFMAKLGGDLMPVQGTMARAIGQQQRDMWAYRVRRRQQATILSKAVGEVEAATAAQFVRLRQLANGAGLHDYIAELSSEPTVAQRSAPVRDGRQAAVPDVGTAEANVVAAIERRHCMDGPVERFEAAVRAVFGTSANSYWIPGTYPGEPTEINALTRWLNEGARRFELASDSAEAMLFIRQAHLAAQQWLPAPSNPHHRGPLDVVHETRSMANATLIERTKHRLDSLWLTSSRDSYSRRGAFTVRNLHKLSELSIRREILANLSLVDYPAQLDGLYYSRDHNIATPEDRSSQDPPISDQPAALPAIVAQMTAIEAEAVIGEFLDDRERAPGGLPLPPETARLLLLDVLQPLIVGSGTVGANTLRRRIQLILDSLAAKGTRGGKLRDHRRLVFDFTKVLYDQGILKDRVIREAALTSTLRRMREFVTTVPRFGIIAVFSYLAVLSLGALFVDRPVRSLALVSTAAQIFGLGTTFSDRPFLTFFALLIVIQAVAYACRVADPTILIARTAPILAVIFSLAFYNHGLAEIGPIIALTFGLVLWSALLLTAHRFVVSFVSVDANMVLGASFVFVYLIHELSNGQIDASFFIILGMAAAVVGPAVPVAIGSRDYASGRFRYADDRARVRVVLDSAVTSGLVAFVLVDAIGRLHGMAAAFGFALMQLIAFFVISCLRLSTRHIKAVLTGLQIGTPLTDGELQSYLRRALARSTITAAAALAGAVAVTVAAGETSTTKFLLAEWAGVILLSGALSGYSALSVAGTTTPLVPPRDDTTGALGRLRELREQFRAWRRMRFSWIWKTAFVAIVVFGLLRWVSDLLGVAAVLQIIHRWIDHLFS